MASCKVKNENATGDEKPFDFFAAFNRFVDSHLADIGFSELKALLVFFRHADSNGVSYPSAETVAGKTGMLPRNAKRAMRSLAEKGLLRVVEAGGGAGNAARRKVVIPKRKTVAQCAMVNETKNSGATAQKTVALVSQKGGAAAQKTVAQCATRRTHKQTSNKPAEQQAAKAAEDAAAAGVVVFSEEETRKAEALDALAKAGIGEPTRSRLIADVPGLTAAHVRYLRRQLPLGAKAGLLVHRIRADGPELIARYGAAAPPEWQPRKEGVADENGFVRREVTDEFLDSLQCFKPDAKEPEWMAPTRNPTPEEIALIHGGDDAKEREKKAAIDAARKTKIDELRASIGDEKWDAEIARFSAKWPAMRCLGAGLIAESFAAAVESGTFALSPEGGAA